jgi:two-component system chemotaxis sensor kinase CheA
MDKQRLIQRLMATFLGEFEEHVRALDRDLLHLERAASEDQTEILKRLFRTAHSLKGAAGSVDVILVEGACHRLESILGGAREGLIPVDAELIQLLFTAVDALKDASERLRANQDLGVGPIPVLLPQLDATANETHLAPDLLPRPPAPPPIVVAPPPEPRPLEPNGSNGSNGSNGQPRTISDGFVRVPAEKLDALLSRSDELLIARSRSSTRLEDIHALQEILEQTRAEWRRLETPLRTLPRNMQRAFGRTQENFKRLARGIDILTAQVAADHHRLEQAAKPLDEEVKRVRMLPFRDACEGIERAVRDLARAGDKDIGFVVVGSDVELDRSILEGLKDPLLHLVRNAVGHGLESPEERIAKGKSGKGLITVAAAIRGTGVEVVVADDGRGIDLEGIRAQARKRRMAVPDDERELARLVLLPGFSTAQLVTELSGRGVGLDAVKHQVESLHGTVDFSFAPNQGTRFVLTLPLTLTTLRALLVESSGQVFALPTSCVRRLVRVGPSELGSMEGREVLLGSGQPILVASLAEVLGIGSAEPRRSSGKLVLAVVATGRRQIAFAVDELQAEHDIVVKSLGPRLRHVRNFTGATMLPTGRLALIVNPTELIHAALARAPVRSIAPGLEPETITPPQRRRLLVVDDSVTTRSLERFILEAAGYDVLVAADGLEAWQRLQTEGADLVVADVEMPRMDGFGLVEAIRASQRFQSLPIVLVTALESEKDKARGLEVGADAYLPKSTFDQRQLLETIAQLI